MVRLNDSLRSFLHAGNSIIVGTRDPGLVPHASRGVGLIVAPDREHLTLFLPEVAAATALRHLADVPSIAITCSDPPSHRTVQLKGTVVGMRPAGPDELAVVESYRERFVEVLARVGMAPAIVERLTVWPCRAVEVAVTALFDQTPGPDAGCCVAERDFR